MKYLTPIIAALFAFALATPADAQCRSFTKRKCMPEMAPFQFNETFNAAQLAPGEEAEVDLTFYSGQHYRLLVCDHPILQGVNWQLVDGAGNTLFKSTVDDPKEHFDFKVATTQRLKVHIDVPARPSATQMLQVGCVSILIGYK